MAKQVFIEDKVNIEKLKKLTDKLIEKDEALRLRTNYLQGLVDIQSLLLINNSRDIFNTIVSILGNLTGYSRVYIYRLIAEDKVILKNQWLHPSITNSPEELDVVDLKELTVLYDYLKRRQIYYKFTRSMSEDLKVYFSRYLAKTVLVVPIYVAGELWGFLGVDNKEGEDMWPQQAINLFTCVTSALAIYIKNSEVFNLKMALDYSGKVFVITDVDGMVVYVNKLFTEIYQYTLDDIKRKKLHILTPSSYSETFYKDIRDTILSGKIWKGEFLNTRKDGVQVEEMSEIIPIKKLENGVEVIQGFINIKEVIGVYDGQ